MIMMIPNLWNTLFLFNSIMIWIMILSINSNFKPKLSLKINFMSIKW